jgi:probable F420-dependent oxidoreductase
MARAFPVSITVSAVGHLYGEDLAALVNLARIADAAGIDQLVVPDHVVMGPRLEKYPYGRFPLPLEDPWPEPLTLLAAMASASSRVRLGTGVLITPLRPAALLAKTLATLDVLSRGRLDVGVGTGWQAEEYAAEGLDFERRWQLFDDGLRACRVLWRDAPAAFESPSLSFRDVWCLPRPLQPGGPPLWFGVALGPKNLARIAELGSGWMPMDSRPEVLREGVAKLHEALRAAGRSFEGFGVRAHLPVVRRADRSLDLDATLAGAPALLEAGATSLSLALAQIARERNEIPALFERIGAWQG